jgi:uncharacterized protein
MKKRIALIVLILLASNVVAAENHEKVSKVEQLTPIDMRQVKVGGEIGRRIDNTINENLLKLDFEKVFLPPFRAKNAKYGYVGLGKTVDAMVRFAAYSRDPRVLALKKHIVDEVIKTQGPDGYIGTLVPKNRLWGVYDAHEMSYMALGLANDYKYFGENRSLEASRKLADFIINRWSAEEDRIPGPNGTRAKMYGVTTGLDGALLTLFEQSGDRKYLDFLVNFKQYRLPQWNVKLKMDEPDKPYHMDDERHTYIYMALCVAQLQLHNLQADPRLLKQTRQALDFLTKQDGLLISGSCSLREAWHDNQCISGAVSESCATAYLTRMLDRLLRLERDSKYGDMMERAIYNALFAAQSPDGRKLRYFTPPQGKRVYYKRDTYCCPNNFRRIMAELPEMIYYRQDGALAVNLYTQSGAKFDLGDGLSLAVRQETDYPSSGKVVIHVDPSRPAKFPLRLRIPRWADKSVTVAVNGKPIERKQKIPGGRFFTIDRQWKAGDVVELNMPMQWRFIKGRKKQAGLAALMRGPMLFCLSRANNKALEKADLRLVTIDPSSLTGPTKDDSIRPGGLACRVKAWSGSDISKPADLDLVLTEFADPGGEATYFRLPDLGIAMDDELIQQGSDK